MEAFEVLGLMSSILFFEGCALRDGTLPVFGWKLL